MDVEDSASAELKNKINCLPQPLSFAVFSISAKLALLSRCAIYSVINSNIPGHQNQQQQIQNYPLDSIPLR